jgi:uncharacterized repeat protein (TIGR01451 family)
VGQPLTYSLVVRNDGPDRVNGVTLTDALPAGATLVSAAGCTGGITCALGSLEPNEVRPLSVVVRPTATGTLTNTATVAAAGITDLDHANDSRTATTQVNAAPTVPAPNVIPGDDSVTVKLKTPATVGVDEFIDGITVEASCTDEPCLRRFREHAAINTGAAHIAGFNLTVFRGVLARTTQHKSIMLVPCKSGAAGRRHRRCIRNLRKAAQKAAPFRVKVVVGAVDAAGNRDYAKAFIRVTP